MAGLDDIINLSITIQSSSVIKAGFGVPLITGYHTRYTDVLVRSYSSSTAMTSDGFLTTDPEYLAAATMFSQNPRPGSLKIGRRSTAPAQRFEWTPATAVSTVYKFTMAVTAGADQVVTYTSSATANAAEIINGLTAAVAALSAYGAAGLTASNQTTFLRVAAPAAGPRFDVKSISSTFSSYKDNTADAGIAADLTAIELEDAAWYGFCDTTKASAEIPLAAAWVQTRRKFFATASMNSDIKTSSTSDLGTTLHGLSYTRTSLAWKNGYQSHFDAAYLGRWLPFKPGEESMKFKTIIGQSADTLTDTELGYLRNKKVNHYINVAGVDMFAEGVTCQGEYMDTIRFVDWLYANIQEDVFEVLSIAKKVSFTDTGVGQIESAVRAVLQRGVQAGGLAASPAYNVIVPAVSSVSTANKSTRTLPDVSFTATLAGAIHNVQITGTVSV